jgi:hypothetical protein
MTDTALQLVPLNVATPPRGLIAAQKWTDPHDTDSIGALSVCLFQAGAPFKVRTAPLVSVAAQNVAD